MNDPQQLIQAAANVLFCMVTSLTAHEWAHAQTACWLGDDTASLQGRLTLNPVSHIDIWGSILIPVMGILSNFPFIGWAKPVPITPLRFTRRVTMRTGIALTAVAGPLCNLGLALVFLSGYKLMVVFDVSNSLLTMVIGTMIFVNIALFLFNLLPIPPLDGAKVLVGFLPNRYHGPFETMERTPMISFLIFMLLIFAFAQYLMLAMMTVAKFFFGLFGLAPMALF